MAKSFPLVKIDAIDADPPSTDNDSQNVGKEGLRYIISTYLTPVEKTPVKEKYDLVMTFESINYMAYPIDALQKMKDMVYTDGAVLVGDVKMEDKMQDKKDFAGRIHYNFSVLLCLPQSMAHENSAATGAAMTPSTFKRYANEAGFTKIDTLPVDHLIWKFYRLSI